MLPVQYLPQAEKFLKRIRDPQLKRRFEVAINRIRENPQVGKSKKHDLAGIMGYDVYYNNTNYEIAYKVVEIDGETVLIILAGTRENFYEELKKYLKRSETITIKTAIRRFFKNIRKYKFHAVEFCGTNRVGIRGHAYAEETKLRDKGVGCGIAYAKPRPRFCSHRKV